MSHCSIEFHFPNDLHIEYFPYGYNNLIFMQQLWLPAQPARKTKEDIMGEEGLVGKRRHQ